MRTISAITAGAISSGVWDVRGESGLESRITKDKTPGTHSTSLRVNSRGRYLEHHPSGVREKHRRCLRSKSRLLRQRPSERISGRRRKMQAGWRRYNVGRRDGGVPGGGQDAGVPRAAWQPPPQDKGQRPSLLPHSADLKELLGVVA
jgi:hypothetical protein